MRDPLLRPALLQDTYAATMPIDRQKSATPAKPFTPTLSTSLRKPQSPLTPKLAGPQSVSPISPSRRVLRSETALPTPKREDFRSPANSKLNGNVTPRSGARKVRIGGDSPSTPGSTGTATPSRTRPLSAIDLPKRGRNNATGAGLGILCAENRQNTPQVTSNVTKAHSVSGGLGRRVSSGSLRHAAQQPRSPRLFLTNGGHLSQSPEREELSKVKTEASIPHIGDVIGRDTSSIASQTTPALSLKPDERGKFFFANDPALDRTSTNKTPASSVTDDSPSVSSPHLESHVSARAVRDPHRPSSPEKAASLRSAPATFSPASGNSIKLKAVTTPIQPSIPVNPSDTPRRSSVSSKTSTIRERAHRKLSHSISAPSTPPKRLSLRISPQATPTNHSPRQPALPPSPIDRFSPRSTSLSSINTGLSSQTHDSTSSNSLHPLSPTKSETPQLQRMNELAANARRERKVLDLEISNSSLLAINKTLERETRKQSLELRRFRRASRPGRQPKGYGSVRSTSGQSELSTLAESEDGAGVHGSIPDLEEEMSNSEDGEDSLESSFDDDSSYLLSPASRAVHDVRHRSRDSKRLMLDLAKHQQLLIDSQKMNQSIKRCLAWTEDLIAEGQKALDYHVKVSDVELGGKVLADDHDDIDGDGDGDGEGEAEDAGAGASGGKALLGPSNFPVATPPEVQHGRRLWRQGLEEMELEVDRMLASSSTLKEEIPTL